jgi:hypothetical protein
MNAIFSLKPSRLRLPIPRVSPGYAHVPERLCCKHRSHTSREIIRPSAGTTVLYTPQPQIQGDPPPICRNGCVVNTAATSPGRSSAHLSERLCCKHRSHKSRERIPPIGRNGRAWTRQCSRRGLARVSLHSWSMIQIRRRVVNVRQLPSCLFALAII